MYIIPLADLSIRLPDRRKTGRLRRHNIDADSEIRTQRCHARSYEFHHLILHITVFKYRPDNSQRHILRSYALYGLTRQIYRHYFRSVDIIGLIQKLLHQLRTAFPHSHSSQRAVAGMGIRSQYHLPNAREHLPGILMDNRLMRRYVNAAIPLRACQPEHVVILIDCAAHRTERIMAVRQHIGHRKLYKP